MHQVFYQLPPYIDGIIDRLSKRNWLVHNFNLNEDAEIYNVANFLYNSEFDGTRYVLTPDLNIYQFLLNIVKKPTLKDDFRDAASLLVFCQVTNIDIDPTFSVYEKVNYDAINLEDALPDLELFHNLNNTDMDVIAKYALGYSDSVRVEAAHTLDYEKTKTNLMKYEKLKEWDTLYLMVLSIIDLYINSSIPQRDKISAFCDWMIFKYRRSLVAFIYAVVLFGNYPIRKMMKYKNNQSPEDKRKAASNMTWDLYILNQYFRRWTKKDKDEEFLYASNDTVFNLLLREAIKVQISHSTVPLKKYMNQVEYQASQQLVGEDLDIPGRAYNSEQWGPDYRAKLIKEFENKLFI